MSQFLIIIGILLLLICAAAMTLWLDARQKTHRSSASDSSTNPPFGEICPPFVGYRPGSRWLFLHRLANYRAGIAYDWHPAYVLLAGVIAAAGNLLR